ncbi:MAG TPA: sigma-70 family RNA polymerase sigma factor [Candidatus Angelobacter sp.]|nr:sigma-70 family RNA polymerase sigma factor [Candidatus Angelobacter sp.]
MQAPTGEITRLLTELTSGDSRAVDQLMPLVYSEMRKMARRYLRQERYDHTLQPTALVHEAYLKLVDQSGHGWQNRAHFFAIAAQIMRRILIDHARTHRAEKRGGAAAKLSLDVVDVIAKEQYPQLIVLDEVLSRLQDCDPRQGRIVELRFFGGLTEEEISEVIGISVRTVKRDWKVARAWLYREMTK